MDAGTTLVLAGAHAMAREGLKLVLETTGRMTVVGETDCPEEAVRISGRMKPDILVIDLGGQWARALRAIQGLRARSPETNVLVITDPEQEESLDAIHRGGRPGMYRQEPYGRGAGDRGGSGLHRPDASPAPGLAARPASNRDQPDRNRSTAGQVEREGTQDCYAYCPRLHLEGDRAPRLHDRGVGGQRQGSHPDETAAQDAG